MKLSKMQEAQCDQNKWDFSDLKALFINCTLKKSGSLSHTNGLIEISKTIIALFILDFVCGVFSMHLNVELTQLSINY